MKPPLKTIKIMCIQPEALIKITDVLEKVNETNYDLCILGIDDSFTTAILREINAHHINHQIEIVKYEPPKDINKENVLINSQDELTFLKTNKLDSDILSLDGIIELNEPLIELQLKNYHHHKLEQNYTTKDHTRFKPRNVLHEQKIKYFTHRPYNNKNKLHKSHLRKYN